MNVALNISNKRPQLGKEEGEEDESREVCCCMGGVEREVCCCVGGVEREREMIDR
jgi:hypothetical protein